ncbi:hypothetical protein MNBD_GAMMA08-2933 [hydrothermal vent metagenome]|uniref:Uncharacterized protein n=1 Tax=hydrothermal vent metagenome TaxID=652676 RepID=A0A3B0X6L9_9ZZZZ
MLVKQGVTDIGLPGTEGSPLKFRAFCPDPPGSTISDWGYLFSNVFMPSKAESNTYVIESKGCDGAYPLTATVKAYPQIKANIKVNITYNYVKKEDSVPKKNAPEVIKTQSQDIKAGAETSTVVVHADNWEIGVALGGSVDSISLGSQLKVLQPSELLKGLRESISIFLYLFDLIMLDSTENILSGKAKKRVDLMYGGNAIGESVPDTDTTGLAWDRKSSTGTGKIGIRYPKIELALEYANAEIDQSTELGYKLTAELKADPLLGIGMEIDILTAMVKIGMNGLLPGSNTMLEAGEKFGKFIWEIINDDKDKKEEIPETQKNIEDRNFYFEAGISLVMKVGASIGCGVKWEKQLGDSAGVTVPDPVTEKGAYSAAANASLDFLLEGKVYVKGRAFMVMFEAGLMIALGSAKAAEAAKIEFKYEFTTVGGQPAVAGGVEWNGLAFLFASYWSAGVKRKDNADGVKGQGGGMGKTAAPTKEKTEAELALLMKKNAQQWVLIDHGKYPKDPVIPLDEYAKL